MPKRRYPRSGILSANGDGLREMRSQGATLEDAKKRYTIERDFPYFKDKRLEIRGTKIHEYNIEAIWERIAGK